MFLFRKIWFALFLNTRYKICPFPLLQTKCPKLFGATMCNASEIELNYLFNQFFPLMLLQVQCDEMDIIA